MQLKKKKLDNRIVFKDKSKHFIVSFLLFVIIYWIWRNASLALAVALGLAIIKEIFDNIRGENTFRESAWDFLADILGIALGAALLMFFYS